MNLIDSVVGWLNPRAGAQRIAARRVFSALARDYDAASRSARTSSLRGRATSANTEIGASIGSLRDRARDLERNSWIGTSIADKVAGLAVGTGIQVRFATGSKTLDKRAAKAWKRWCKESDVEGVLDFHGQILLAVRTMVVGGEALIRFVPRPAADSRQVKLALQVLEGDHIDSSANLLQTNTTRLGVEVGEWGERIGLHLFRDHPGEGTYRGALTTSALVRMDEIVHLYRPLRPGQVRGVSWFAPMLLGARDYADLMEALVLKAKIESCFAGFVESDLETAVEDLAPVKESDGSLKLKPGLMSRLRPGEKVSFANPTSSTGHTETGLRALMGMAAAVGLTFDQLTGDLRQSNYSSLRAGKIEQRRLTEQLQWLVLVPMALDRIVKRWVQAAILGGILPNRAEGYPAEFVMPAVEPIDPLKDLQADVEAVRSGRLSPQDFIGMWGRDWTEVIEEHKTFFEATDGMGLAFDIDGRRPKNGGSPPSTAAQASDPAAQDDAKTDPADPAQQDKAT